MHIMLGMQHTHTQKLKNSTHSSTLCPFLDAILLVHQTDSNTFMLIYG